MWGCVCLVMYCQAGAGCQPVTLPSCHTVRCCQPCGCCSKKGVLLMMSVEPLLRWSVTEGSGSSCIIAICNVYNSTYCRTGLYAESHGIIANVREQLQCLSFSLTHVESLTFFPQDFHDPQYHSAFVSNRPGTGESHWWLGEPVS